ncbi:site-2 protease family protein [Candidatus Methylacidiphilum infernorum]|uniref:Membrane-fusion protein, contains peptidase family M50 domain n=1 Tax=Methylacidiphilum infernorum (isolate V4) TaxID=481448 RepID=B3DZH0_METI4|nr:site-2 protease family protein [Candidatus Methylacidiphilum infernorum]ACD82587.1 Membrane-fusion protein, contains peptidase family M50 domain [Methylacidiphilum infernorum V4]
MIMPGKVLPSAQKTADIVPYKLRSDLLFQKQLFQNKTYFVVKDPLALTYCRLPEAEAFLAGLFDGKRTAEDIAREYNRWFPQKPLSPPQVLQFLNLLLKRNLVILPTEVFLSRIPRQVPLWKRLWSYGLKIFFIKLPLIRPSLWLDWIVRRLWWLWSPQGVFLTVCFWIWTLFFLFLHRSAFLTNQVQFLSPQNILLLYIATAIDKTLHEFGHAATCRRFGGEIHEMGVGFFFFIPVGYVDASDSWIIPDKKARIFIAAAGVYTELIIAAIAAHLWILFPLGLAKNLAFNMMVLASVTTLFFNFNPLMKFDGYYALVDLLEIPNLREKAFAYCTAKIQDWLLGYKNARQARLQVNPTQGWIFFIYSFLAIGYMLYLIHSLGKALQGGLKEVGLGKIGEILNLAIAVVFVGAVFMKVFLPPLVSRHFAFENRKTLTDRLKWMGLGFLFLGGLLFFPSREKLATVAVAQSQWGQNVSSPEGGIVKEVWVWSGQRVRVGQALLRLENHRVETDLQLARLDLAMKNLEVSSLGHLSQRTKAKEEETMAMKVEEFRSMQKKFELALKRKEELVLRSTIDGIVVSPEVEKLVGRYFRPGETLLKIRNLELYSFLVPLTAAEARIVSPGAEVKGIWIGSGRTFQSFVKQVGQKKVERSEIPPGLLIPFGGKVPLIPPAMKEQQEKNPYLFAFVPVPKKDIPLVLDDMRAKIIIKGKKTILGAKLYRLFTTLFISRQED